MKKLSAILVLVVAAALLTSVTASAATKVSKFEVGYTTKKAAASSGLAFDISFRDPAAAVPQGLQSFCDHAGARLEVRPQGFTELRRVE